MSTQEEQSKKLGILFLSVGLGCLIGPILFEPFTRMDKPRTVLRACVLSFIFQAVGCFAMGYFRPFGFTIISTIVRSAGSSVLWIDSQVLLQLVVKPEMLGRVVAIDYGFALAAEASSAMVAGLLQDNYKLKPRDVSSIMGIEALFFFIVWTCYSTFGSEAVFQIISENSKAQDSMTIRHDNRKEEMKATERTRLLPHCV
jgi:MFS family permease